MSNDTVGMVLHVLLGFIPFLFALCAHEYAHGWVANKLGDPTAKLMGRLTLNPSAHYDLFGTIIFPIAGMISGFPMLGWAKPVPVNPNNLKNEKVGMFWVALAGPGSNILMALAGGIGYELASKFIPGVGRLPLDDVLTTYLMHTAPLSFFQELVCGFLLINMGLALFNLIPLNPLDGGKIFAIFFSDSFNRKLEQYQMVTGIIILLLVFTPAFGSVLSEVIVHSSFFVASVVHSVVSSL